MDIKSWTESVEGADPPSGASVPLKALWWAAKGQWDQAHQLAQDDPSADASWVHAYLHRVEGDLKNAAYWYRRAGRPVQSGPFDEEWDEICRTLIGD